MAYTIGTSHGPFTGTGSFVIAKPAGIRTIVTNIPAWTGHENESPRRYFRLGRFTLGNSHGFSESQLLEYAQQLVYPIPAIWELLAYDINDGASCTFYELVAVPDLTLTQPWDRTPQPIALGGPGQSTPGGSSVTTFSYVVPAGRKLWLSRANIHLRRWAAASTVNYCQAFITVNSSVVAGALLQDNTLGANSNDEGPGGGTILNAGNVLAATVQDLSSGGLVHFVVEASGFLFDA